MISLNCSETQQGIFDAVLKGHIDFDSDPWPLISESAKDLIRKMLCSHPSDRLTAHQVLSVFATLHLLADISLINECYTKMVLLHMIVVCTETHQFDEFF